MATNEVVLALLRNGPAHGYDLKRDHDAWFPDSRPLAFGQVYATLARLERGGLVEIVETRVDGGPERTIYAISDQGEQQLSDWLAEPAGSAASNADEIVRKTVAALRTGVDPGRLPRPPARLPPAADARAHVAARPSRTPQPGWPATTSSRISMPTCAGSTASRRAHRP